MKKTYISPEVSVHTIQLENIIAVSGGSDKTTIDVNSGETVGATESYSRKGVWTEWGE